MNIDKLRALHLAIESGSISAASEQLNYTPSAVSRSIESLEQELGVSLIVRSKSGVRMTAACEALLPEVDQLLRDEVLLREHAQQIATGRSGTIRLGLCYPAFYPWLSSRMAAFQREYPDLHYTVRNGYSSVLLEQISRHEIDLCLISRLDNSCNWVPLFEDDLVAVLPPGHPLAEADSVPLSLYAEAHYLELHSDKETDNHRALKSAGIKPKHALPLDDSSAMYAMVEAGLGIGMENRVNTRNHPENFLIKPIDPPQILPIGIAYRDGILPIAEDFIEFLAESRDELLASLQPYENTPSQGLMKG